MGLGDQWEEAAAREAAPAKKKPNPKRRKPSRTTTATDALAGAVAGGVSDSPRVTNATRPTGLGAQWDDVAAEDARLAKKAAREAAALKKLERATAPTRAEAARRRAPAAKKPSGGRTELDLGLGIVASPDVLRTAGTTIKNVGKAVYDDPVKQTGKALSQGKEMLAGLAGLGGAVASDILTVGSAPALAGSTALRAIRGQDQKKPADLAAVRIAKGAVGDYSRRYGDLIQNKPGSGERQLKRIKEEGPLPEILDASTLASGGGAVARAGAKKTGTKAGATVGRIAKDLETTPRARLTGAVVREAKRAARSTERGAAILEPIERGARAVKASPQKIPKVGPKLGPVAKQQRADRRRVARDLGQARVGADSRVARTVEASSRRSDKFGDDLSLHETRTSLGAGADKHTPSDKEVAAALSIKYGIRQSKGAPAILSRIVDDVIIPERTRRVEAAKPLKDDKQAAAALVREAVDTRGDELVTVVETLRAAPPIIRDAPAVKEAVQKLVDDATMDRADRDVLRGALAKIPAMARAEKADAKRTGDQLPALRRLIADPKVFDDPDVVAGATRETARTLRDVGADTGHSRDQATAANTYRLAETLKVPRRKKNQPVGDDEYVPRFNDDGTFNDKQAVPVPSKTLKDEAGEPVQVWSKTESPDVWQNRVLEHPDAKAANLVAPGYFPSVYNLKGDKMRYATRGGAAPGGRLNSKREGDVFREGREFDGLAALEETVVREINEGFLLRATSNILEREGIAFKNALAAERAARDRELKPDEWVVVPIRATPRGSSAAALSTKRNPADFGDYVGSDAAYLVPSHIWDEVERAGEQLRGFPNGVAKSSQVFVGAMLGLNPGWGIFQAISDTAVLAAQGASPAKVLKANKVYKAAPPKVREQIDMVTGGHARFDTMGMDENALRTTRGVMLTHPILRHLRGNNPFTTMIRLDAARTQAFRRAGLMKQLERADAKGQVAAAARLDRSVKDLNGELDKIWAVLDEGGQDMLARLADPELTARAGEKLIDAMGDWSSYTAFERTAKPYTLFYGYLRYATRLLFYTLPKNHPTKLLLALELGRQSAEESKRIIGEGYSLRDLVKWYDQEGRTSIDLSRAVPVLTTLTSASSSGNLIGLAPPGVSLLLNQIAKESIWKGRDYRVKGQPSYAKSLDAGDRARIALSELLRTVPAYRAAESAATTAPQSDDTLLFSPRPLVSKEYATNLKYANERAEAEKQGSAAERALLKLIPLVPPRRPDRAKEYAKSRTKNPANASGAGGDKYGSSSGDKYSAGSGGDGY